MDNCAAHTPQELESIKIEFFPPNTTSVLQPMDMGIIRCLKINYRKKLVSNLIVNIDESKNYNVDILDCFIWLKSSWI